MATARKTYDEQPIDEPIHNNDFPEATSSFARTPEQPARTFNASNPVPQQPGGNRGLWFVLALAAAFVIGFTFWMLVWAPRSQPVSLNQSAFGTITQVAAVAWGLRV